MDLCEQRNVLRDVQTNVIELVEGVTGLGESRTAQ